MAGEAMLLPRRFVFIRIAVAKRPALTHFPIFPHNPNVPSFSSLTGFHPLEISIMFGFLKDVVSGLVWGFTMAVGWIAAFALLGVAAA